MGEVIKLNVYDLIPNDAKSKELSRDALDFIGMGVFHSGVEAFGEEISFGADPTGRNDPNTDGVFIVQPHTACGEFRESIELGRLNITKQQLKQVLESMKPKWRANSYHLLGHNCNCFTKEFCETLSPSLMANYPTWVNRVASTGNVVVPDALVGSIMEAVAPPFACAPDLINKIFVPYAGNPPKPLPAFGPTAQQQREAESKAASGLSMGSLGGFLGKAKGAVSSATNAVSSLVDDSDKKDMVKIFPELSSANVVGCYSVCVIHINRVQKATLYVTDKCLAFAGSNKLCLQLPYTSLLSVQFGVKKEGAHKNIPPNFDPTSEGTKADSLLLFYKQGLLVPVFDFGSMMDKTVGFLASGGQTPVQRAIAYIDGEWRKNVTI